ncbi:MAG TPA: hypothetical protein VLA04_06690 [Verrucomicrobiae bacterium]|nr:hypothetical protein [Verrucomicrobiae bacterium]
MADADVMDGRVALNAAEAAEAEVAAGNEDVIVTKSYFIRNAPFGGTYCILAGLTKALRDLMDLPLDDPEYYEAMKLAGYGKPLRRYLRKHGRLRVQVYAPPEGTAFFPKEPIVTLRGPVPDLRLLEGIFIQDLNFDSLNVTDWHRAVMAAAPQSLNDQSWRRSQAPLRTSLNALLAGCIASSNEELRRHFQFDPMGTQGHEWPMSCGLVFDGHHKWITHKPHRVFNLVDTDQVLKVDYPAFLDAVYQNREHIMNRLRDQKDVWAWGPRNDSGDLAFYILEEWKLFLQHPLSKEEWFYEHLVFPLANNLDEYKILEIKQQIRDGAARMGLDGEEIVRRIRWGIGTNKGVSQNQPALDGVMKLGMYGGYATVKLALGTDGAAGPKTSIPGFLRSARLYDPDTGDLLNLLIYRADVHEVREDGLLYLISTGEALTSLRACHPDNEQAYMDLRHYRAVPQQALIYDSLNGDGLTDAWDNPTIDSVSERIRLEVSGLPWWTTRFASPTPIKVSLTAELFDLRKRMIAQGVLREDLLVA